MKQQIAIINLMSIGHDILICRDCEMN